jgi:hypothetical protein
MNAATTAIPHIMTTDNSPPPPLFDDNHHSPNDSDIMHNYAIDTLFDPSYHTTDTEEIETKDALRAPDKDLFIAAKWTASSPRKTSYPFQRQFHHQHFQQACLENTNHS